MRRFQSVSLSFVKKPKLFESTNQIAPIYHEEFYQNTTNQYKPVQRMPLSNRLFRQVSSNSIRRNSSSFIISRKSNRPNSPKRMNKFCSQMTNATIWTILSTIFQIIIGFSVLLISIYLVLVGKVIEIPPGTIILYSGNLSTLNSATYRWLLFDGSEVFRSSYSDLFNVIGTTYGSGNGKDTFNLPDFRARFPLGSNKSDSSEFVSGGHSTHVINVTEMPSHTHDTGTLQILSDGLHSHSYTDPGHDHGGSTGSTISGGVSYGYGYIAYNSLGSYYGSHSHTINRDLTQIIILSNGSHTHELQGDTGFNGSNQAMNMMPPYQTIHYIIRA